MGWPTTALPATTKTSPPQPHLFRNAPSPLLFSAKTVLGAKNKKTPLAACGVSLFYMQGLLHIGSTTQSCLPPYYSRNPHQSVCQSICHADDVYALAGTLHVYSHPIRSVLEAGSLSLNPSICIFASCMSTCICVHIRICKCKCKCK